MKLCAGIVAIGWCCLGADMQCATVSAWRNTVEAMAAADAVCAYTSNVIRCEWAGEDRRIADLMPANLSFQFAVIGDGDVTNRVRKILEETASELPETTREELERCGHLVPALQWIVRFSRPSITNSTEYLRRWSHPAAFQESDFDADRMKALAKRLKPSSFLLPVKLELCECDSSCPLGKAEPVEDYADILPEETFSTPFGAAVVLRAPERLRVFRFAAATHPMAAKPHRFVWGKTYGAVSRPWLGESGRTMEKGFAEFVLDVSKMGHRLDVMVFAEYGNGLYSAPAIVSFYKCPLARRDFSDGKLKSISCNLSSGSVPYDISPIWIPREWKDEFEHDEHGRIIGFERTTPGSPGWEKFSARGEYVLSSFSSGLPEVTREAEYFVAPESGRLECRPAGEETRHRIGENVYRRSGE